MKKAYGTDRVIESRSRRAVVPGMTVSPEVAPVGRARVQIGVARMRAAIADGTLHHHRPDDIPAGHRSSALAVVRAWAAGEGIEVQRRHCGVCSTGPYASA